MKLSRTAKWILAAGLAVSAAIELVWLGEDSGHGGGVWHHIPLFDFVYGVASCWIIVVGSKAIGHAWLQRPEGYYASTQSTDEGEAES